GDYKAAAQTARDFVSLYPGNSLCKNVYLIMGNALVKLGQHSDAVDAFQRIIDLDPSSEIAEQALFSILQDQFGQKAYDSILTSYQYIFHNLPPSRSKWRALSDLYAAEAYLKLNRLGEAQSIYEMILKVYPDQAAAFYAQDGLAWVYAYKGDDEHALQERQKLQDMLSAASSSFTFTGANELGIADSLFNQKSYEDASRLYDQYVKDNPQAPEAAMALYKSGLSLYHQSYYSQAIEKGRALIAGYPRSPQTPVASYQVADTLFRAQKYPEAEAEYKRIISSYPDSPQLPTAFLRLAQIAYDRKDDPAALKLSQSLIARFPDAPEANDGLDLAEAVFDRDQKVDYRSALRAIIAAVPGKTIAGEAQFRLARRLFDEKRYAEAADEFQKFSVDYTNHPE
ncbi:MAG: tetratricopeptide repeat protein, partial [Elusimicrobia bacterium]|nr:tetratricopeptide repeat protein [Elusimicrobiota bacterium]